MAAPDGSPQIYFPDTINDLMHLRRDMPDALIYAGGTYILKAKGLGAFSLPERVISLQEIEDLDRISRTERHLEVGAMVSVKKLLLIGKHVIPTALYDALQLIAPPGIKNLATLGGNICIADRSMTSFPVLQLMDATIELRRHGNSRWVQMGRFRLADGTLDLREGEVLTRIRVPLHLWNIQVFRRFGTEYSPETQPLSFCGLARTNKAVLEDVRMAFSTYVPGIVRDREVEADLAGRKLPIAERDITTSVDAIMRNLEASAVVTSPFQRKRARRLAWWFLTRLADEAG